MPAVQTHESLVSHLRHLQDVFTRPEYQLQRGSMLRGKLTVQEKVGLLFDAATFAEDLHPALMSIRATVSGASSPASDRCTAACRRPF